METCDLDARGFQKDKMIAVRMDSVFKRELALFYTNLPQKVPIFCNKLCYFGLSMADTGWQPPSNPFYPILGPPNLDSRMDKGLKGIRCDCSLVHGEIGWHRGFDEGLSDPPSMDVTPFQVVDRFFVDGLQEILRPSEDPK